jgi:hypothetical protein
MSLFRNHPEKILTTKKWKKRKFDEESSPRTKTTSVG